MLIIDIIGLVAAVTSAIGFIPQIVKTHQTKSATDLSILMLTNYTLCSLAWVIYGGMTSEKFVLLSNLVGLIASIIMLWQKHLYTFIPEPK